METTHDTQPGATTPSNVHDLRNTSDIRLVMIEVAKVEERVNFLIEDNKSHKSDFRLLLVALIGSFLVLAGFFVYGYNRISDKHEDSVRAVTKVETKIDDLLQRLPVAPTVLPSR